MEKHIRICLLLIAGIPAAYGLDSGRALAQYVHRIWQSQQGLPQATIFSILQTHDGYLWLGTQAGLVRFDGVHFSSIDPDGTGLRDAWVRDLAEDRRHDLWIATSEFGVLRLRDGHLKSYSAAEGLPSATVHALLYTRRGELWAATAGGVARLDGDRFVTDRTQQGPGSNNVRALCESADGSIWSAGDGAVLNRRDGRGWTSYALTSLPAHAIVRALLCDRSGAIWLGSNHGLVRFLDGKERRYSVADGLADDRVFSLAQDRAGALWIGTDNGLSRLLNGEFDSLRTRDGLSQSRVYSLLEDHEGDFWVGTKHGLNQFLDGRVISYTRAQGLPSNDTGPVLQDSRGVLWAGTINHGLARYDGRRFATVEGGDASINTLWDDPAGGMWIGGESGLTFLRDGRPLQTYTSRQGLPGNVVCLFRDHLGMLWAGTSTGPAVFEDRRFVRPPEWRTRRNVSVLAFGEDLRHRLFLSTQDGGLYVRENGNFHEVSQAASLRGDVDAFYADRDGGLWIGTLGGGLGLYRDGRLFTYSMRDGLFDDEIYGIAEDNFGNLWMACSKGIFSVARADLLSFAAGVPKKIASRPYTPTDALRTIECRAGVQPAIWRARDGRIWFSTIRGLLVLDPAHFDRRMPAPPSLVEAVTVNGRLEDPEQIENMTPERRNLEFRYTGLSFLAPAHITFRYILEGFDKNWIDAGTRREALYANLPPGRYVFRVSACNMDGTCDRAGATVAFRLAPHYYQRPWFLAFGAALVGLAAWLIYGLRIRRLREQFQLVLGERNRIARELHDTLIQGFAGVTMQMQALCARLTSPRETGALQEIIADATAALREARLSVAGLRDTRGSSSARPPAGFPQQVEYNLLRIAQEALANALRHSGARTIEVSLESTAESLDLAVKDDGAGMAASGDNAAPGHYGLLGMRERARLIGAGLKIESKPGGGTTVRVRMPANEVR